MNQLEDHADTEMTRQLRDSLSGIPVSGHPALGEILSRGRGRRRRRVLRTAGAGVASIAAGSALTLGLTGALGGAAVTPAFTLTANSSGTDTLTLNRGQVFDPAALQRALAEKGIPALVEIYSPGLNTDTCRFLPQQDVFSVVSGTAARDGELRTMIINPAAIPAGTELFFFYFNNDHGLVPALIEKGCSVPRGG